MRLARRAFLTGLAVSAFMPAATADHFSRSKLDFIVFFNFESAKITPEARAVLAELVQYVSHKRRIIVEAHCDTSEHDPMDLSARRAWAVRSAMMELGYPVLMLTIRELGSSHLLVPTPPNTPEPQNRRVTFDVID